MKILLINDAEGTPSPLMREIEQNGHEIIMAADCLDASVKLRDNRPDIIISTGRVSDSDCAMLADGIKKDDGTKEIPIISCSRKSDGEKSLEITITIDPLKRLISINEPGQAWPRVALMLEEIRNIGLEKRLTSTKAELSLLQNISLRINAAEDLKSALTATLEAFCGFDPCFYAEAWLPTPRGLMLEAYSDCGGRGHQTKELIELGKSLELKAGTGLPGSVFVSRETLFIRDISTEGSLIIRAQAAIAAGLNAVVCSPVLYENNPIAVLLFFMSQCDEPAFDLLETINAATAQLGPVIRHKMVMGEKNRHLKKYEDIINNINVGIFRATHEGVITEANPAFITIFNGASREDIIGRPFVDFFIDKSLQARLREKLSENGFFRDEVVDMYTMKGHRFIASLSAYAFQEPDGLSCCNGIIEDITEKKRMEDNLQQLQKMDAIGKLSGGIAHEFNNILAAIIGYGNLLLIKKAEDHLTVEYTGHILTLSEKAARLTRSMLAFGKRQIINPIECDIFDIISRIAAEIRQTTCGSVTVKTLFERETVMVPIDAPQIMDVLRTLASNAIDAMPGGGTITIAATRIVLDDTFFNLHGHGQPGAYAFISFIDTGAGMNEATRKNAFEPFFTTKEVNKGTGLGLSMAYGIIKQHNGFIDIQSEPGSGTAVMIYLPLAARTEKAAVADATRPTPPVPPVPPIPVMTGTETVLLAEDQPELRLVTASILKEFGYTVIEAKDGKEALEQFNRNTGIVKLVILDLIMPAMGGVSAYHEIIKTDPSVEAIFMSGYPAESPLQKGPGGKELTFIRKPFMPGELLTMIRMLLDTPPSDR